MTTFLTLVACGGAGTGGATSSGSSSEPNGFDPIVEGSGDHCPEINGVFQCSGDQGNYNQEFRSKVDSAGRPRFLIIGLSHSGWISDGKIHEGEGQDKQATRYSIDCSESSLNLTTAGTSGDILGYKIIVRDIKHLTIETKMLAQGKSMSSFDLCHKK